MLFFRVQYRRLSDSVHVRIRPYILLIDARFTLERVRWSMGQERSFSAAESAEIWDRWQRGEGLKLIGRMFGKNSSSIFAHLRPHGGIRPAPRRRSRRVLGLAELVAGKLAQNWSPEPIAGWQIGKASGRERGCK